MQSLPPGPLLSISEHEQAHTFPRPHPSCFFFHLTSIPVPQVFVYNSTLGKKKSAPSVLSFTLNIFHFHIHFPFLHITHLIYVFFLFSSSTYVRFLYISNCKTMNYNTCNKKPQNDTFKMSSQSENILILILEF